MNFLFFPLCSIGNSFLPSSLWRARKHARSCKLSWLPSLVLICRFYLVYPLIFSLNNLVATTLQGRRKLQNKSRRRQAQCGDGGEEGRQSRSKSGGVLYLCYLIAFSHPNGLCLYGLSSQRIAAAAPQGATRTPSARLQLWAMMNDCTSDLNRPLPWMLCADVFCDNSRFGWLRF